MFISTSRKYDFPYITPVSHKDIYNGFEIFRDLKVKNLYAISPSLLQRLAFFFKLIIYLHFLFPL